MKDQEIKNICPTTTSKLENEGALLVDVRENEELEELSFDVQNLLHVPLSEFEDRYTEIPLDQSLVMVCRSGARSLKTAYYLINQGYQEVKNLEGGIIKWAEKGFPVKGSLAQVKSASSDCCSSTDCC
ncbi:rhodanese-like domain-containing protein [Psychroflexus sp. CAK8W]|uniref:Rhodanese-like domain-containing protein n=1 Tax=Psychroflexus longus TaxID=2873596 RepID=A0ABS7XN51_9FLAO|nr:rhodanese-like domain-containing protein [Psychroflexus longus]MBZ9779794.1 rhodanese-like domain-containing protein [Psychroflexus longus]